MLHQLDVWTLSTLALLTAGCTTNGSVLQPFDSGPAASPDLALASYHSSDGSSNADGGDDLTTGALPKNRGSCSGANTEGGLILQGHLNERVPAPGSEEGPKVKDVLSATVKPEHAIGLEAEVDDLANSALDGA